MAETTEAPAKPRGNPNFGKKPAQTGKYDPKRRYHFQLTETQEQGKPRDKETGEMLDNPYPPIYLGLNSGVGVHPTTNEIENWRYVFGYSSIWVKDQEKPSPSAAQLANPKNYIEFRNGSLFVSGSNSALLDALFIQDICEGNKNQVVDGTPAKFRVVDPDKARKLIRTQADVAFEAEKAAREATFEEMLPCAMVFGIDIDGPEENEERIRTEFIMKAKQSPDAFTKQFTNPKNKFKYNVTMALNTGLISASIIQGKMVLVDTQKPYFDVKEGDLAEQFAKLLMERNDKANELYEQIKLLLA